jgi:protein O-mannosyl-transferase
VEVLVGRLDQVRALDLPSLMPEAAATRPEETPGNRGFFFWGLAGVLAVSSATLACGLPGAFLLDDLGNLESLLAPGAVAVDLWHASFNNPSGLLLRPLSNFSFALNLASTGFDVTAFKVTNIALHLLTTLVVALLARRILPHLAPSLPPREANIAALLAVALWALHPLQVSTVLYVVQRMAILASLFSVLAVASLVTRNPGVSTAARLAGFFVASALALASKESGALTPLLALAVLLCAPSAMPSLTLRLIGIVLPLAAGAVAVAVLWPDLIGGYAGRDFSLAERLATQAFVVWGYLLDMVAPLPSRLAVFRDDTVIRDPTAPLTLLVIAVTTSIVVSAVALRRRFPGWAFAILWFSACHAMESTFLPLELEFEHRNYLALFGPALALAVATVRWLHALDQPLLRYLLPIAPLALLVVLTVLRSTAWSSEESLAALELASRPESMRANNLAAIVARREGDTTTPMVLMRRMQARYPDRFFPWATELDFACDLGNGEQIPWDAIGRTARRTPDADEVLGFLNHITLKVRSQRCRGIDAPLWDRRLSQLAADLRSDGAIRSYQYLTLLRASLQELHDVSKARALYLDALKAAESPEILARVARFEAEHGSTDKARALIEHLRRYWPRGHPQAAQIHLLERLADTRVTNEDSVGADGTAPTP